MNVALVRWPTEKASGPNGPDEYSRGPMARGKADAHKIASRQGRMKVTIIRALALPGGNARSATDPSTYDASSNASRRATNPPLHRPALRICVNNR